MISGRLRAGLVIALIVVCSAIVGAAVERKFAPRADRGRGGPPGPPGIQAGPHPRDSRGSEEKKRAWMLDRMTKSLDLTPVQRAGIDSVMRVTDSSLKAIRVEMQPRLEKVFENSRTQIQAHLTPAQREKFGKSRGGGGGGGRGPRP